MLKYLGLQQHEYTTIYVHEPLLNEYVIPIAYPHDVFCMENMMTYKGAEQLHSATEKEYKQWVKEGTRVAVLR